MKLPVAWRWGAPRLLTRGQVRSYLQVDEPELVRRMASGQVPGPLWGSDPDLYSARWDRDAIDRALDRASAIKGNVAADMEDLDRAIAAARRR